MRPEMLLTCCLLVAIGGVQSCSEPEGYKAMDDVRVLSSSDLFIYAKFKSKFTYTRDGEHGKEYDVKLSTDVMCVVRNSDGASVPIHINITETRRGDMDTFENPCINYFHDIRFDQPVYVMVEPRGDEFGFETFNLQGPYFYESDLDIRKLMRGCSNINTEAPAGGRIITCPLVEASPARCIDLTGEAPTAEGGNNTASAFGPSFGSASMAAGMFALYRGLV